MQNNAIAFFTVCILLCLAMNYTFPLRKENLIRSSTPNSKYCNNSWHWDDLIHHKSIVERSKKMANDIENVLKKFKISAKDIGSNIYNNNDLRRENNNLSDEDLQQYEQLVIMKKYPYLDLKDLEYKYSPISNKNTRQSLRIEPELNFRSESNLYEPDESINVEIVNRGLSGFSIPSKMAKGVGIVENKLKNNIDNSDDKSEFQNTVKLTKKSLKRDALDWSGLQKDIFEFELTRNKKITV